MEKVFGAVLHLSLIGSYTVLLVVLLRFLMLKVHGIAANQAQM